MQTNNSLTTVEVLMNLDQGGTMEELRDAIAIVTQKVDATGKAGKVSLELSFKKLGSGQVVVKDLIKTTEPIADKDSTMFFLTPEGGLSRKDPSQGVLRGINS